MEKIYLYENFLFEKRIAQITSKIEVVIGFDIIKTSHAEDRSNFSKRGLDSDNQNHISNAEIKEFVLFFLRDITESIVTGEIEDGTNFVIKSIDRELSIPIVAKRESNTYWKLIIKSLFRESDSNAMRVSKDQLTFEK
jgi:hypothetical protein